MRVIVDVDKIKEIVEQTLIDTYGIEAHKAEDIAHDVRNFLIMHEDD